MAAAKMNAIEKANKTKRGVIEWAPFQDTPRAKFNRMYRTFKALLRHCAIGCAVCLFALPQNARA
jgi:hypothetical protein